MFCFGKKNFVKGCFLEVSKKVEINVLRALEMSAHTFWFLCLFTPLLQSV